MSLQNGKDIMCVRLSLLGELSSSSGWNPFYCQNPLRMKIILRCDKRTSELSNMVQSRACNIAYDPRNYGRVKTWIVIFLRGWMNFFFFISLVYKICCLFLSLFYLLIFASIISTFPSFSLFVFRLVFFILFLVLTAKSCNTFLLDVSPYLLSDSWYARRRIEILDRCLWTSANFSALCRSFNNQ
jgi:hypothetical protein